MTAGARLLFRARIVAVLRVLVAELQIGVLGEVALPADFLMEYQSCDQLGSTVFVVPVGRTPPSMSALSATSP